MVAYALWSLHLVQTEDQEFKASLEERREEGLGRLTRYFSFTQLLLPARLAVLYYLPPLVPSVTYKS